MTAALSIGGDPRRYPAAAVRCALVDGAVVLLDLRTAEYAVLDPVASAMWTALTGEDGEAARVASLRRAFDAPDDRLRADLAAFDAQCAQRGYLQREPPAPSPPARLAPCRGGWLELRAWWSLVVTSRSLARRGFGATYARCASLPKPDPRSAVSETAIARAERAFARAENFWAARGALRIAKSDCVPRSLALYRFLLSAGVPAEHVIGAMRFPFTAHAWVECGGRVLGDSALAVRSYTPLARL
jgi:hypothetical protein